MEKVSYAYLDDAEYYFKDFNREQYKEYEQDEFKKIFRSKYSIISPVDLLTWSRINEPEDQMLWKQGYWDQIMFVRDRLPDIWYESGKDTLDSIRYSINVISTHRSKSILLPVYEIKIPKYNLTFVIRYNFYDWKISVESNIALDIDFMGLFDRCENINNIYCEGFPKDRVHTSYADDMWHKNFTVEIRNDYQVYMFVALIINYMKQYYL
jgi:hypothetical protein